MFYEASKQVYDFKRFQTIRPFGDSMYNCKIEIDGENLIKADLLEYILEFKSKTKPKKHNKDKKTIRLSMRKIFMKVKN